MATTEAHKPSSGAQRLTASDNLGDVLQELDKYEQQHIDFWDAMATVAGHELDEAQRQEDIDRARASDLSQIRSLLHTTGTCVSGIGGAEEHVYGPASNLQLQCHRSGGRRLRSTCSAATPAGTPPWTLMCPPCWQVTKLLCCTQQCMCTRHAECVLLPRRLNRTCQLSDTHACGQAASGRHERAAGTSLSGLR